MSRHILPDPDRRRSRRARAQIQVCYENVDELFTEFTRDINEGGVFIASDRPLELEEPVELVFELPGSGDSIRVTGRVVRLQTKDEGAPGMAVEFDALSPASRAAIDRLVRSLRSGS
jgi:uncharacterized protein (TIGR02266 family)